ncbi:F-box/kelch-repeat protein At3g06240-like [Triticum aestivum]|nr:F-box/kelch-repeat protein At3g06240-like [Triticum aestivum]
MYAMDLKTREKRETKAARCPPELMEELVLEIFLRLPVKSLLRFKSLSKAWCTTISDPMFIRSHLERQKPSWLIIPHALDSTIEGEEWTTTFSTQIRFYQWQLGLGVSDTRLMHTTDFPGEFSSISHIAHCHGLVLFPTNTKLYIFNPATRDTMTLPKSNRTKTQYKHMFLPTGFGLDHHTDKYKVVRAFVRSKDPLTEVYRMGMEVFTVGDGEACTSWRETTTDLPYPVVEWITGKFVNGGLFWVIDRFHLEHDRNGFVRFSLEDETSRVIRLPDTLSLDRARDESFLLDVIQQGELCLTGGAIMLQSGPNFYRYELQTASNPLTKVFALEGLRYKRRREHATKKNIFFFNVTPYMESLVRIAS